MTFSTERYHVSYGATELENLESVNHMIDKMINAIKVWNCDTAWSLYGELSLEDLEKLQTNMQKFYQIREIRRKENDNKRDDN